MSRRGGHDAVDAALDRNRGATVVVEVAGAVADGAVVGAVGGGDAIVGTSAGVLAEEVVGVAVVVADARAGAGGVIMTTVLWVGAMVSPLWSQSRAERSMSSLSWSRSRSVSWGRTLSWGRAGEWSWSRVRSGAEAGAAGAWSGARTRSGWRPWSRSGARALS